MDLFRSAAAESTEEPNPLLSAWNLWKFSGERDAKVERLRREAGLEDGRGRRAPPTNPSWPRHCKSMPKVPSGRNAEKSRMRMEAKTGVIPTYLKKLFEEMREKGDEFAAQRWAWENGRGKYFGSFEDTTVVPAMCHTAESDLQHATPDRTLQIFSIKIADVGNDVKWPLEVYGFVAIRDSIDPRCNLLFRRDRSNCQTISQKEPFLLLTGPSRAVVVIDPVSFEVQLKVKGKTNQSEDKVLAVESFASQHAIAYMSHPPRPFTINVHGVRCELELTQALLEESVEATIMVEVHDGIWPKSAPIRVTACTGSIDQHILLLESDAPTFSGSGLVQLSRRVVSVELTGQLTITVDMGRGMEGCSIFTPKRSHISYQTCRLEKKMKKKMMSHTCVMGITVAWSLFKPL